jgi:hypothetical protein
MSGPISEEQIRRFAVAWLQALDVHAPAEECATLLADTGLEMVFPEKTFQGISNFKVWYAGGKYTDGMTAPGVINIFFDETHILHRVEPRSTGDVAEVRVVLAWQASWFEPPAPKSKRTALEAVQNWTVQRSDKNPYGLEIVRYVAIAEPFKYAPGFAQL